jgi:hypothetical protein
MIHFKNLKDLFKTKNLKNLFDKNAKLKGAKYAIDLIFYRLLKPEPSCSLVES